MPLIDSHRRPRRSARAGRLAGLIACAVGATLVAAPAASAAIIGSTDADELATAMAGGPVTGAQLIAPPTDDPSLDPFANGVSDAPLGGFPTAGSTFTIMTSGDVSLADQPNDSESSGHSHLGFNPGIGGEANDISQLRIPIVVPSQFNCLAFDYKFLSEEFPEFVGSSFNDGFIAELDSTTFVVDTASNVNAPNDFAGPIGQGRVTINNVGPTQATPDQAAGTTYDAASAGVATKHVVTPGNHTLFLSIFDVGDNIYDTAVFLDNLRLTTESPQTCHPPDTYGGLTGVAVGKPKLKDKGKKESATIPVTCTAPIACGGTVSVKAKVKGKLPPKQVSPSGLATAAAKKGKLGTGEYLLAPGQKAGVKLKETKKGQKLISQAKKLKLTITVTNPLNNVSDKVKKSAKVKHKKR